MPKLTKSLPKTQHRKSSGPAVVCLDGRDFYLGKYGTEDSTKAYDRLIAE